MHLISWDQVFAVLFMALKYLDQEFIVCALYRTSVIKKIKMLLASFSITNQLISFLNMLL